MNQHPVLSVSFIAARVFVYLLFAAALAQVPMLDAEAGPPRSMLSEESLTELMQSIMLALTALIDAFAAAQRPDFRALAAVLALGFSVLVVREADQFLEAHLFDKGWQTLAAPLMIAAVVVAWRSRGSIGMQIRAYASSAPFGLLVGAVAVMVYSRLFGRRSFWETLMGDDYRRVAKNTAEEGVELLAVGLILLAALEFTLWLRRKPAQTVTDDRSALP